MARVYIGIGSNINRDANIRSGLRTLKEKFGDLTLSSVYESKAIGFEGDNFYNLVAGIDTSLGPEKVARILHEIEDQFGRKLDMPQFSPRTLDLDLLLYDDLVFRDENMEIPREDITKYVFVLCPLAEIAGNVKHPVSGKRMSELWESCEIEGKDIWRIEFDFQVEATNH